MTYTLTLEIPDIPSVTLEHVHFFEPTADGRLYVEFAEPLDAITLSVLQVDSIFILSADALYASFTGISIKREEAPTV
jgi:hypothetical protein